ncbi:MAG: ferritin [Endomicrobiia bacterium]
MLKPQIEKELNNQLNRESFSAYLYLSMAAYFENENLKGFAHWLKVQAKEETGHAMKFFNHIIERNGKVSLEKIDAPKTVWNSPLEAFQDAYEHEKKITNFINEILEIAKSEKDYATDNFLQWFVSEQVEEEAQTLEIVQKLKQINASVGGLLVLDHHLGKREG